MSAETKHRHEPGFSASGGRIDRARLLLDATRNFLLQPELNGLAARQFAALARGFLPQVDRNAAIDAARMLAGRASLPDDVKASFEAVGIRFRPSDQSSPNPPGVDAGHKELETMPEHRFFAGPLMDSENNASDHSYDHLDPYNLLLPHINAATHIALSRAADRIDIEDFSAIVAVALKKHGIDANAEIVGRMVSDEAGEPLAMLMAMIGGDRNLVARSIYSFCSNKSDLTARAKATLAFFDTITPEYSDQVVRKYFGVAVKDRAVNTQHLTVQSGQSLRVRHAMPVKNSSDKPHLSERLGANIRQQS